MVFLMRLSFSRHPFTYIAETVMQLHISKNLMKKQTLPNPFSANVYLWDMHHLAVDDVQSSPFKFSASIIFVKKNTFLRVSYDMM